MSELKSARIPVEQLAEEFVERYRRGERPALSEYCNRHPELADEIRDLFPALVIVENLGPKDSDLAGRVGGGITADGRVPEQLGEYRILREVGRGGMGVVYEAEQGSLGRRVALKVLPFHALMSATHLERFRREARAAARLHHTNIVPVYGVGEQDGIHYYAMQFIQGQGLDEILSDVRRLRGQPHSPGLDAVEKGQSDARSRPRSAAESLVAGEVGQASGDRQNLPSRHWACPSGSSASVLPFDVAHKRGNHPDERGGVGTFVRPFAIEPPSRNNASAEAQHEIPHDSSPPHSSEESRSASTGVARSELTAESVSPLPYFQSVARVGVQVADALAHAHSQGVLHRDVKPSNLLLDTHGTVWVTDFGLAKTDAQEAVTNTGDIVGTMRYMAPERFAGWSDPRSDVYSLGLTLYEMLTLRPAFDEPDRSRLMKRIMHDDPPRPRNLDPQIPRDLETIVLKAVDKEPSRRYQQSGEVAEDLRRFLAYLPILARRTSSLERLGRWCRRNPAPAMLAAALVLAFAVGFVGVFWQWQRAEGNLTQVVYQSGLAEANLVESQRQRTLAEANLAEAERQRTLAEANLTEAERQTDRAEQSYQVSRKTLDGLFGRFSEDSLVAGSVPLPVRKQLLELAIEHHRSLVELSGDDPESQAELASSYLRIAAMHKSVGASVQAVEACEKAADLLERATREHPGDAKLQALLAQVHNSLGQYRQVVGRLGQARENFDLAIEIWTKLLKSQPDEPNYLNGLAGSYNNLSYLLSRQNKLPESIGYTERSLEIREGLVERHPESRTFKFHLAGTMSNLAQRKAEARLFDEAIAMRERCSKLRQELLDGDPNSIESQNYLAGNYNRLGDHYREYRELPDRFDRAMNAYQQALELQERLVRVNSGIVPCKFELADTYANMATVHREKGEHPQSLDRVDQAIEILDEVLHQTPEAIEFRNAFARAVCFRGDALASLDRQEEAIAELVRGVKERRMVAGQAPEAPEYRRSLSGALGQLAGLYRNSKRLREAADTALERRTLVAAQPAQLFAVAQDLAATASAITDDQVSQTREIASDRRRIADQSLDVLREAIAAGWNDFARLRRDTQQGKSPFTAVWEQAGYDDLPPQLAFAFGVRAARHASNRDYASAIRDYRKLVEHEPDNVPMHDRLAHLYVAGPAATRNAEKAIQSAQKIVEATPENGNRHAALGAAYYRAGRYQESLAALDRARELNKNRPATFELLFRAMCLHRLSQPAAARQALDRAILNLDGPSPPKGTFPDEFPFLRQEADELLK